MKKIDFRPFVILLGFIGWTFTGYEIAKLTIKPIIKEETIVIKEQSDFKDKYWLERAIEKGEKEFGIKKDVYWAIIQCEGGSAFSISKTNDIGYFQINLKTGQRYGAKDLEDFVNPEKAVELVAKILKSQGLDAWANKKCIIEKLISVQTTK